MTVDRKVGRRFTTSTVCLNRLIRHHESRSRSLSVHPQWTLRPIGTSSHHGLPALMNSGKMQLTYTFFLPDTDEAAFRDALNGTTDRAEFFEIVDEFLPKYVTRVYGGNPATVVTADSETLSKFDCQFLDALRDVESEMFSGRNPLLRQMLEEVLDLDKKDHEKPSLRSAFRERSMELRTELVGRLDTPRLFQLVSETGGATADIRSSTVVSRKAT